MKGSQCGDGRPRPSVFGLLTRALAVALATVREIFDESAYSRFLSGNRLESSPQAYAAFRRENEAAKMRRPKCC